MPSVHIPEGPYSTLADEYGYAGAKDKVKDLVKEHASELNSDGDTNE